MHRVLVTGGAGQRLGWRLPDTWSGYSQHAVDTLPLPTKHLSAAEVLRFRDEAFQAYFTHPRYLDLVQRKFGDRTVADVREMTSHRLERAHHEPLDHRTLHHGGHGGKEGASI